MSSKWDGIIRVCVNRHPESLFTTCNILSSEILIDDPYLNYCVVSLFVLSLGILYSFRQNQLLNSRYVSMHVGSFGCAQKYYISDGAEVRLTHCGNI